MEIDQNTARFADKVSLLIKELSFVGVAIIWLFKTIKDESILLDKCLLISIFAFISAVAFQFLQYLSQSLICAVYAYYDKELTSNSILYWLPWILWAPSVISCVVGYVYLMTYIWCKISIL